MVNVAKSVFINHCIVIEWITQKIVYKQEDMFADFVNRLLKIIRVWGNGSFR